ncbi:MAG TPA: PilZ domain-containing protein [Beijerinckiaceae bacterium]|jgi:hypothetical protein
MDERRESRRRKTLLAGKIVFGADRITMDCSIRDLSMGGARLSFADPVGLPNEFELQLPSRGTVFRAEVRWRRGREVGVKFRAVLRWPTREPERMAAAG